MTEKALYYENEGETAVQRRRRRRFRPLRALFLLAVLALIGYAMFSFVYWVIDDLYAVVPITSPNDEMPSDNFGALQEVLAKNPDTPESMLELLSKNPETYDFVMGYSADYKPAEIDIAQELEGAGIPLFLQWDSRWGYDTYGTDVLGITGCGPTCMAMVASRLLGDDSLNPRKVAEFSMKNGYYAWGSGTAWAFMSDGATELGLCSTELKLHGSTIIDELRAGRPVICAVGNGDFTTEGHFIVLTGVNADGTVNVNDPNSIIRSEKSWELDVIMKQIKNLWSFSAA